MTVDTRNVGSVVPVGSAVSSPVQATVEEKMASHHDLSQFENLTRCKSVERWLRFRPDSTKYFYCFRLRQFLRWAGPRLSVKDADDFLRWARSVESTEVQDIIDSWGETMSVYSRPHGMATVRSFLKKNGYNHLPSPAWRMRRKNFHEGYKREEVQKILSYLDDGLEKLYALVAKDSGLRANDLLRIRYRHTRKDLEAGKEYVHIAFEPEYYERRKSSGITFLGPNSIRQLRRLIEQGEVGTDPDRFIFPYAYSTILQILNLAKKKAGLDPRIQPNHGFRKFFTNQLARVGMDVDLKRRLEGHHLGVEDAYTERDVEVLRPIYAKAYQYLDITEEGAVNSTLSQLQQQVVDNQKEIVRLRAIVEKLGRIEPEPPIQLEHAWPSVKGGGSDSNTLRGFRRDGSKAVNPTTGFASEGVRSDIKPSRQASSVRLV